MQELFNFENSINSSETRKQYTYRLEEFLSYCKHDLHGFLKLPVQEITNLIIKYLVEKKVSKASKAIIFFSIKHACEMNDILLNWKKIRKFIKSEKTGNEIAGKDRGYTHEEIQTIIGLCDQRLRTAFLVLASTGMRIGALGSIKIGDLEKIDGLYKITVYAGEKEQYISFTTVETAKEIDSYLEFRKRRGEKITSDSYLIVKQFKPGQPTKAFKGESLRKLLQESIDNSGLREIDHEHPRKRKQIPVLHGLRKFTTKQLVDSKVNSEIREMLLGHDIGLIGRYYKPTQSDMLAEWKKAVDSLTIDPANRLRKKVERLEIEKSQYEELKNDFEAFKAKMLSRRK
jgi:integrase